MEKPGQKFAKIVTLEDLIAMRPALGRIVCTSGGFDPIHPGHTSCIIESKKFGDTLVVLVNGDEFLTKKKGKPFQDVQTRCRIVASVRDVDYVFPFTPSDPSDSTVIEALERIRPHVFTKGGDRVDAASIPEWDVCQKHHIELITGVGLDKQWSSSDFLKEWGEFYRENGKPGV